MAPAADPTGFRKTSPEVHARYHHTATLLRDGRVLVLGGEDIGSAPYDDGEIFDPATETWAAVPAMSETRTNHTATLLADGRVLVTGGGLTSDIGLPSGKGVVKSAAIFDPSTGQWSKTGDMLEARAGHRALALADGRVLVVGGATDQVGSACNAMYPGCTIGKTIGTAEVFDPATGTFSAAGTMSHPRIAFAMTRLHDDKLLVMGGADDTTSLSSVDVFDPASASFAPTGSMIADRLYLSAATLGSGRVIAVGGKKANVTPLKTTEIYDPVAGTWTTAKFVDEVRTAAAMLTLSSGHVIAIGGYDQFKNASLKETLIYDEPNDAWSSIGALAQGRADPSATLLLDGRVLVVGGCPTPVVEISE